MSRPDDSGMGTPVPELDLPKNFPGLGGDDGQGPDIDHAGVREVISRLRKELGTLRGSAPASMSATWSGPGTVAEVAGTGNIGSQETGKWEVARFFGGNTAQAYEVFGGSYYELLDHVEKWADAVEKAVNNYEKGHADSSA
jgi:hypothetical protein